MKVVIISLRQATRRREEIEKQFFAQDIAFEWCDAIDGQALDEDVLAELVNLEAVKKSPNWLTRGAIGCALSHCKAYKIILEKNLPYAVVLEDDVILKPNFLDVVNEVVSVIQKNEIILLYTQSWQPLKLASRSATQLAHGYTLFEPVDILQPITAAAYVITNEACASMLQKLRPISLAADSWGSFYKNGAFENLRCLVPSVVETADAKSTIDYIKNGQLNWVLKLIDTYRIFPFYEILKKRRKINKSKMKKFRIEQTKSFKGNYEH